MNLTKPFTSGLGKWMRKAARPSGSVNSLNPHRWRSEWLHHHVGGVCWLFVLFWMDSWRHELIVCKIWYKNTLKMRLTVLLFDPPTRAPYQHQASHFFTLTPSQCQERHLPSCPRCRPRRHHPCHCHLCCRPRHHPVCCPCSLNNWKTRATWTHRMNISSWKAVDHHATAYFY